MKKRILFIVTVVLLSSSFASANWFKELWLKTQGEKTETDGPKDEKLDPNYWLPIKDYHRDLFTQRNRDVRRKTPELVHAMNQAELLRMEALAKEPVDNPNSRAEFVSKEQATKVLNHVKRHPVVGFSTGHKYDPEGGIGFCFGRAMYTHLLLLHQGVDDDSIMKIWAVGPMYSGSTNWRYHVSTLVKAAEGGWWVIDRYTGKVMTIQEWMDYMMKTSSDDKLKFYFTTAKRFGPSQPNKYDPVELGLRVNAEADFYNHYFKDMMNYFKTKKDYLDIEKFDEDFNFRHEEKFEPKPIPFAWRPIPLNFFGTPSCSAVFLDLGAQQ